ncbi:MAG: bifunctional aldolase/short-chain dehydrogenase [Halobacteriovoraceae bacterium]|nr:bifunctional aldolase/short-chain dehydrogenase [Halobacteriovoraceae bacterium]
MKNRWNDAEAQAFLESPLELRAYTSRLLGQEEDLVLHGGGNTSVKKMELGIFGGEAEILYVKGSGWDLKTIKAEGFSACRLNYLKKLAALENLDDVTMMRELKKSQLDPSAPAPSVEALLHALIPFKVVDHTHADAVVALSNTPKGEALIKSIYGEKILVLPYTMPGFILSKQVFEATQGIDWDSLEGIILLHHGVFTFSDNAKVAYDKMIELVTKAEDYLSKEGALAAPVKTSAGVFSSIALAKLRKIASDKFKRPMIASFKGNETLVGFSQNKLLDKIATQGCLTPDHVIQTKRIPFILDSEEDDFGKALDQYEENYKKYFKKHGSESLTCLDTAPRFGFVKNCGLVAFAPNLKRNKIIVDIVEHTAKAIQWSEHLGGWRALPAQDIFDLEYWELEQAKLKKGGNPPEFEGKIALVTGAASGIGRATVESLLESGAVVAALDINPKVKEVFSDSKAVLPIVCDLTNREAIQLALDHTVQNFGGLDIVVSNAGSFPKSARLSELSDDDFDRSLQINLSSHQKLLRESSAFLKEGVDPSFIIVGSKNVAAPGPGAGAYSAAKAGLNQLARIAALELGEYGIRVNSVHPNAVFDTGIWNDEVLEARAKNYKMSVEEYKKNNVLKTIITSSHVADLIKNLCGATFLKTTGAQIPIDGGNERVI